MNEIRIDILNGERLKYSKEPVTKDRIINTLKASNIPYPQSVFTGLRRHNILLDVEFGTYKYSTEPIHISLIEQLVRDARATQLAYSNKVEPKREEVRILNEESAIAYLKKKGYKILKKTWEEV